MANKDPLGSAWMVIAALLFTTMNIMVKQATVRFDMNSYEMAFWRSLLPALMIACACWAKKRSLKTPHLSSHLKRSLAGSASLLLWFYGLSHLPLATATTLSYTSVIFIAILSLLLYREIPSFKTWFAVIIGLGGIALMLQPAFDSARLGDTLLTLCSGVFSAFAMLQVRELSQKGEPVWRIVFYFSSVATLLAAVAATWSGWHSISWQSLPYLLGVGITGLLAQLAMTHAYHVGRKFTVAALSYLTVVFSACYGMIFLNEPFDWLEVLGIVTVIAAGLLSALPEKGLWVRKDGRLK